MENRTETNPHTRTITQEEYDLAMASLQFHQAKVDYYIQITRAFLYQIERKA